MIRLGTFLTAVLVAGAGELLAVTGDFDEIKAGFGRLHTIAGRGLIDSNGGNDWDETYEGGGPLTLNFPRPTTRRRMCLATSISRTRTRIRFGW